MRRCLCDPRRAGRSLRLVGLRDVRRVGLRLSAGPAIVIALFSPVGAALAILSLALLSLVEGWLLEVAGAGLRDLRRSRPSFGAGGFGLKASAPAVPRREAPAGACDLRCDDPTPRTAASQAHATRPGHGRPGRSPRLLVRSVT